MTMHGMHGWFPGEGTPAHRRRALLLLLMLLPAAVLSGCGGYRLEGVVYEGDYGDIFFVDAAAPVHQDSDVVAGAEIRLHRDAGRPNQQLVASGRSDDGGRIVLSLKQFGAGWMQEQWLIQVTRRGYETIERVVTLPSSRRKQKLVVVLREGQSLAPVGGRVDPLEDFERFRR